MLANPASNVPLRQELSVVWMFAAVLESQVWPLSAMVRVPI